MGHQDKWGWQRGWEGQGRQLGRYDGGWGLRAEVGAAMRLEGQALGFRVLHVTTELGSGGACPAHLKQS